MRTAKFKKPSTYLIVLSFIMLNLALVMACYVHDIVDNLKFDAKSIN